jgi:hypothetical protein
LNDELSKIFYLESDLGSEFESSQINLWMIKIIAEAKAMEKEQIIDAFTNEDNIQWNKELRRSAAEQYYNETFGGDK